MEEDVERERIYEQGFWKLRYEKTEKKRKEKREKKKNTLKGGGEEEETRESSRRRRRRRQQTNNNNTRSMSLPPSHTHKIYIIIRVPIKNNTHYKFGKIKGLDCLLSSIRRRVTHVKASV